VKTLITILTILIFAFLFIAGVRQVFVGPIWSVRDEIAHFDFAEQLSRLNYPKPDSLISDRSANLCRTEFDWIKPYGYDGTTKSMGLAGWSYESHNPPIYYASLASALAVMNRLGFSAQRQVWGLRLLTFLFYFCGGLLLIPLFRELNTSWGIPKDLGIWLSFLVLSVNHILVTTLGNDSLSFLLSSLMLLCGFRWLRINSLISFIVMLISASLLPVVKLTNSPLIIVPSLFVIMSWKARSFATSFRLLCISSLSFLPVCLFFICNLVVFGNLLGSDNARKVFATFVNPISPVYRFWRILIEDSCNLQSFGLRLHLWIIWGIVISVILGVALSIISLWSRKRCPEAVLYLICSGLSLFIIGGATFLNSRLPGVLWYSFRHYYGFLPFWGVTIIAFPFYLVQVSKTLWMTRLNRKR